MPKCVLHFKSGSPRGVLASALSCCLILFFLERSVSALAFPAFAFSPLQSSAAVEVDSLLRELRRAPQAQDSSRAALLNVSVLAI